MLLPVVIAFWPSLMSSPVSRRTLPDSSIRSEVVGSKSSLPK